MNRRDRDGTPCQARRAALALLLVWITAALAPAIPTNVMEGGHVIGTIDFANYGVRYIQDNTGTSVAGGAHFESTFNFTGCPEGEILRPGTQFRWVQIVTTNSPQTNAMRGNAPQNGYVDPWSPPGGGNGPNNDGYEDAKPFYWTDAEWANPAIGGNFAATSNLLFSDTSSRAFTAAAAQQINWLAELNLVCTWGNQIHALGYYSWGWTMPMGITAANALQVMLNPANIVWTAGASPGLGILNNANEFGNNWQLTNQDCCIVPEASTYVLMLLGLGMLQLLHVARRRGGMSGFLPPGTA